MGLKTRTPMFYGPGSGSVKELSVLVGFLDGRCHSDIFTRLAALFDADFAAFMAVFQGEEFSVPTRIYLERAAFYCRVWLYVAEHDGSVEDASETFNLPVGRVESICEKVQLLLERRKTCERKKKNQKSGN